MIRRMKKDRTKKWDLRRVLECAACVAVLAGFYRLVGCPIRLLTGVSWLCRKKLPRAVLYGCMYAMVGVFAIVYVYRLFRGDGSVVVFDPRSGLIFRVFSRLKGGI